jgi:hypothetical protein
MVQHSEQLWARRLRWRLRGAWMWPAYAVLTLLDAVILHELPPVREGVDFVPGLIVASFGNLFLMGAVAPWLGKRLAQREQVGKGNGIPPAVRTEVLKDRSAAVLLAVATLGLVVAGLGNREAYVTVTDAQKDAAIAARDYVEQKAPAEIQRNVEAMNRDSLEDDYFRMCVPFDDRHRAWCFFVDTSVEPPDITPDSAQIPNLR